MRSVSRRDQLSETFKAPLPEEEIERRREIELRHRRVDRDDPPARTH